MERDFFNDRDWFLIILLLLGFMGLGMNLVYVGYYISEGMMSVAWLNGLALFLAIVLVVPFVRYNRWAYLVLMVMFIIEAILGVFQATSAEKGFLYRYVGFLNIVLGLVWAVGLLGRWRDFMGPGGRAGEGRPSAPRPSGSGGGAGAMAQARREQELVTVGGARAESRSDQAEDSGKDS